MLLAALSSAAAISLAQYYVSSYMYLQFPNGQLWLPFSVPESTGNSAVGLSTRTVNEGYPGGTPIQVYDWNATCSPLSSSNNQGSLQVQWYALVICPYTMGEMPVGTVAWQYDEVQSPTAFAWAQVPNYGCDGMATQSMISAYASEWGPETSPSRDSPTPFEINVQAGSQPFSDMFNVKNQYWDDYEFVLTTNDSTSWGYTPHGVEGLIVGAATSTIMNFNQSGANGTGTNLVTVNSGDPLPGQ